METQKELINLFNEYIKIYPNEKLRQSSFLNFLNLTSSSKLYRRDNFSGHITGSAFILNKNCDRLLLLKHKTLGRWLQPGGHLESNDNSILNGCLREIKEETGIRSQYLTYNIHLNIPLDIDSHTIPANYTKKEKPHIHHDLRYCFRYLGSEEIVIDKLESDEFKWVDLEALKSDKTFAKIVQKLKTKASLFLQPS